MQCTQWLAFGATVIMAGLGGGCATILGIEDTIVVDAGPGAEVATFQVRVIATGIIEPVSLRLEDSEGAAKLLSVLQDGEISFPGELVDGVSYTVTFAADAGDCVLEDAIGVIGGESPRVVLVCPMLDDLQLVTARPPTLAFEGTKLSYAMDVSLMAEAVSVQATASRSDIEITVAEMAATSGQPSAEIPLALGANEIAVVARHPPSGASIRHVLTVHRAAAIAQHAYGKASNPGASDHLGWSIALSATGDTLAVGATGEDSQATGIGGDQNNDSATNSGAVYVFTRRDGSWSQEAYIKASNTGASDSFGWSVALSATGETLAVGARQEDSSATGIGGNQTDDSTADSGAVYVFTRRGDSWSQEAYIKASNTGAYDNFGVSVALSAAGDTLAVGAVGEDSQATGINGNKTDDSTAESGAVYVFTRRGESWSEQAYVKASNTGVGDNFGRSVALSAAGDTLAVGAYWEASQATGINGNQADDSAADSGAVYVFARAGGSWSEQAYIKASNTGGYDNFGISVALSATGDTLAVGAWQEDSQATDIEGNQADDSAADSGAVYVFARAGESWSQEAYVKASNTNASNNFGVSVALSATGDTLAVGAWLEDSQATGIGGDQAGNSAPFSGAVYVFARRGESWSQEAYVKASNTGLGDNFGRSVALSATGDTLAVGTWQEDSQAMGINGNQADDGARDSGAVYLFY